MVIEIFGAISPEILAGPAIYAKNPKGPGHFASRLVQVRCITRMVAEIIVAGQIVSGLLMALDYFITKDRIVAFEARVRIRLSSFRRYLSGEHQKYWVIGLVILLCHLLSSLASLSDQISFALYIPELAVGILGVLFIPLWWAFDMWPRFLIHCPKGLIAACMFPVFVAATATQIYKLIHAT